MVNAYKLWKNEVSRLWLTSSFLLVGIIHMISSGQATASLNYPHIVPDVSMHNIIPNGKENSLTETKTLQNLTWQHFNYGAKSPTNIDSEKLSKTIIQSLALILQETLMSLGTSNVTIQTNFKPVMLTIYIIANTISPSNTQWLKDTRNPNDLLQADNARFLSRESLFNLYNEAYGVEIKATQQGYQELLFTKTETNQENMKTCQSCQLREKAKIRSIESIKHQILMRLQLSRLPNITKPNTVPHIIIDKFYRNFNSARASKRNIAHYYTEFDTMKLVTNDLFHNSHTFVRGLTHTEENVALPPSYTKLAATHATQYQFGQQRPFELSNTKTKYQSFHRLHSKHGHFTITSRDNRDNLSDGTDFEHEEEDVDIQNDGEGHRYNNYQQQIRHINRKREQQITEDRAKLYQQKKSLTYSGNDNSYDTYHDNIGDIDHESYSHVNAMYIFPTGREWMREHCPEILEQKQADGRIKSRSDLVIMIHHVAQRSNNQNITYTLKLVESRHRIPSGLGQWLQFEIKKKPINWLNQDSVIMSLAIKTQESWMRPFLAIDTEDAQNKQFPLYIEALIKQPRRRKRSTSLDCQESDHEVRCCRYPLKVNFTNFGWNFVVAPTSFDAYFCNGECKVGYLEQYTHTHIASLTTSATPCCSPTKMSPLSLLYFDQDHNLVLSTIPNMSVEKCSCS
ncbi:unnamed protein product [Ceratitis capitata]|uniref:(Mediterranean fruit fly) hypothetical protein n=1 Tax=Ceratitis capitata TaxID=7213 RepID=A0A811USR3_CERCA|nr:unnamed protein product [Ceratitis capitata]